MADFGFRKTKNGFSYYGDLSDCLALAKKKLLSLEKNTSYIERRYKDEKRRYDSHCNSIENIKTFIRIVERELKEQEKCEREK